MMPIPAASAASRLHSAPRSARSSAAACRRALRRVAIGAAILALGACDAGSFQGEIPPCRCEVERCTSASCGYELRLDSACSAELDVAEILIDGHLEQDLLEPGGTVFPCTRTEPGVTSELIIRGGEWVWGPLRERCETAGETRLLVLQCVEAGD